MMDMNQVTVPVTNIEESISFYEALGLRLIVKSLPEYARFEFPTGNATFSLHRVDNKPSGEGAWIYFEVDNLDKYVYELTSKGIQIEQQPEDKPWLWREARLRDPAGNQLILYYAGSNRKDPPWRIQDNNE